MFEPWQLAAMEDHGYGTTNTALCNRIARCLAQSPNQSIDTEEFRCACIACGVDPDSVTTSDLARIQRKLDELT